MILKNKQEAVNMVTPLEPEFFHTGNTFIMTLHREHCIHAEVTQKTKGWLN
jgi:hypothetical protein